WAALLVVVGLAVFLARGIHWNQVIHTGPVKTELMEAAERGEAETLRLLLKQGADPNVANEEGQTALYFALREYHTDIARALLEAGADINHADRHGDTALILAARADDKDLVRLLLKKGANARAR